MAIFIILVVGMVSLACTHVQSGQMVFFQYVQCVFLQLYFYQVVKREKRKRKEINIIFQIFTLLSIVVVF